MDSSGDLFIADPTHDCIREVNATTGVMTTVAGNGTPGYSGDGGLATNAELDDPDGVAVDASGDLFIADSDNSVIREVNAGTHVITTVAGRRMTSAIAATAGWPPTRNWTSLRGVAVDAAGDLFIADTYNSVIREVNASTHDISHRRRRRRRRRL